MSRSIAQSCAVWMIGDRTLLAQRATNASKSAGRCAIFAVVVSSRRG
jgi:hypothetical protein